MRNICLKQEFLRGIILFNAEASEASRGPNYEEKYPLYMNITNILDRA